MDLEGIGKWVMIALIKEIRLPWVTAQGRATNPLANRLFTGTAQTCQPPPPPNNITGTNLKWRSHSTILHLVLLTAEIRALYKTQYALLSATVGAGHSSVLISSGRTIWTSLSSRPGAICPALSFRNYGTVVQNPDIYKIINVHRYSNSTIDRTLLMNFTFIKVIIFTIYIYKIKILWDSGPT